MNHTRRAVLQGSGVLTAGLLAGCIGDGTEDDNASGNTEATAPDGRGGFAAFFTLADWAQQIAGEEMEIVDPVPAGELGHGWEPTADLQTQIAESDVFIYLDNPEWRWAQEAAESIDGEDTETVLINALEGVDMLEFGAEHGHEEEDDHHDEEEDDHHDEEEDDHQDEEDDHDHDGELDPHVWVDPVRAQTCVDNIAEGLARADPDNEGVYLDNAEAYKSELQELHERLESLLADRQTDTIVFGGHNSFGYLADRYGFSVHSPQGVSPQDEPTSSDIIDTIELVNEEGISHIAYGYFESDRLAEQIVAESDATETVAMTTAAGSTPEWNEDGWGYIDQMEAINFPALEATLNSNE